MWDLAQARQQSRCSGDQQRDLAQPDSNSTGPIQTKSPMPGAWGQILLSWLANDQHALVSFYMDDDQNRSIATANSSANSPSREPSTRRELRYHPPFRFTAEHHTWNAHALAFMTAGGRTRYLYAPESVQVIASEQPPTLDITQLTTSQFRLDVHGQAGQTLVIQVARASSDLCRLAKAFAIGF